MGQFIVAFRKRDSMPKEAKRERENLREPLPCNLEMQDGAIQEDPQRLERRHSRSVEGADVATHAGMHVCCGS